MAEHDIESRRRTDGTAVRVRSLRAELHRLLRRDPDGTPRQAAIPLLVGLPLIVVACIAFQAFTLQSGHAWGDDWALYLLHAKALVEGRSYDDTGFLYHPESAMYSPRVYPPGLPVLIAPIYAFAGPNLLLFKVLLSLCIAGIAVLLALLARGILPAVYGLGIAALIAFQPFLASYKNHILPDLPFVLFVLAGLLLARRLDEPAASVNVGILAGLVIYFATALRTIGITLIAAVFLHQIVRRRMPRRPVAACLVTSLFLLAVQSYFLPGEGGYVGQLADAATVRPPETLVPPIFTKTGAIAGETFLLWGGVPTALRNSIGVLVLLLALAGFLSRWKRFSVAEAFIVTYGAALLVWPAVHLRYVLPLVPLLLYYAAMPLAHARTKWATVPAVLLLAGIGAGYVARLPLADLPPSANAVSPAAMDVYAYVKRCTRPDHRFAFARPRAFALLAERLTVYTGRSSRPERYMNALAFGEVDFVVIRDDDELHQIPAQFATLFTPVYGNELFTIHRYQHSRATDTWPETMADCNDAAAETQFQDVVR